MVLRVGVRLKIAQTPHVWGREGGGGALEIRKLDVHSRIGGG